MTTFMERLRRAGAKYAAAEIVDPWRLTLERVRGDAGWVQRTSAWLLPQGSKPRGYCRKARSQQPPHYS